jgi:hypothetical protein
MPLVPTPARFNCSLEANRRGTTLEAIRRGTNGIPLGRPLPLTGTTVNSVQTLKVSITQIIPWFLKVYISTLQITTSCLDLDGTDAAGCKEAKVLESKYKPAVVRTSPCFWELSLEVPAKSQTAVKLNFERAFLGTALLFG